jgi:hypothetical protein
MEITQILLRERFSYNSETGVLTRRIAPHGRFFAGERVGWFDAKGYLRTGIAGKYPAVHRLIWLYVYGVWPREQLDHINGIKDDNRLINLREASNSQNTCNRDVRRGSESGLKGITQDKRTGRWRAYVHVGGKRIWLGFFTTKEEAHSVRLAHSHVYGEFARETDHSHVGKN